MDGEWNQNVSTGGGQIPSVCASLISRKALTPWVPFIARLADALLEGCSSKEKGRLAISTKPRSGEQLEALITVHSSSHENSLDELSSTFGN